MTSVRIEGLDDLEKRLTQYQSISLERPVAQAISHIQTAAKGKCSAKSGELGKSIFTALETRGNTVTGTCYTNKRYGPYVEFGTGPRGQENHRGVSPNVSVAYTQSPWWIHESQIDGELAEKYHWFHIDTPEGRFYQCNGQPARPYMYPALKDNEEEVVQIIKEGIEAQLR